MPNINASFDHLSRAEQLQGLLDKLEVLSQNDLDQRTLAQFDTETERLLARIFGADHRYLETYEYALTGEAEALVNLPESAQESISQDVVMKSVQQRRQVLQGILPELEKLENEEKEALIGEDNEDPPSMPT